MTIRRDAEGLEAVGLGLHGEGWIAPLAADLGINRETIRRWRKGVSPLPADHDVWQDIARLLRNRATEAMAMADRLARLAGEIER